jgi:phage host-nuclease inhibitor protein Gam
LEFQLNKPEEDRNVELVNLLEAEVAKRGPVSEAQKRVADIADEFIAAGVPPLEARKRAEDQIKEQDEADALAAAEATQGEQRDTGTVVTPSGEGVGVAGVSDTGVPPGGPSGVEPSGVVPTSEDARQPPAGEGEKPASVIKTLEELAAEDAVREAAEEERRVDARGMGAQYADVAFDQRNDHESLQEAIDEYRQNLIDTLGEQGKGDYTDVALKAFDEAVIKQSKTTPPTLRITKYDNGGFGLDWLNRGIPAVERVFETEEEARKNAAQRFAGEHVADGVYTWDNETQTAIPPAKEAPATAEAPKKRGRPPLTEEQKAAKAASQQPAGKRGRKPLTE